MQIFKDNAPLYWAKGMPAIPLHSFDAVNAAGVKLGKAPILAKWQMYHEAMPSVDEQKEWLEKYPDVNIGLPLGKQSRCVALDIDTEISAEEAIIKSIVPQSPWVRVGKKGCVMMFKYNGEQTFRIKDITGRTICELLSSRTQVVLPPSWHPDTKAPYVANSNLYDVVDRLPILPKDLESILRNAFVDKLGVQLSHSGWTRTVDFVSAGSRDVKMTSVAGIYAQAVLRGEVTLKEAMDMMRAWVATQTEKVAGDNVSADKAVRNLVKFLMNDVLGPKKRVLPKGWDINLDDEEKKQLNIDVDDNCVSWDFNKLNEYLCDKIATTVLNSAERNDAIEFAVEKIARSQTLSLIEEEKCLKHIVNTSNDLTMVTLRKRINEIRNQGISGRNHTEIARAALKEINDKIPMYEAVEEGDEFPSLRYYNKDFWRWGGSNWEKMDDSEVEKVISTEYGDLPAASRANDHKGILHVMSTLLKSELKESSASGVNFANGFVDIFGQLHNHSRKYGCTYTLPYCYRKELADLECAPKFKAYLESSWGKDPDYEQKVKTLRQVMAATIFGLGPSFNRAVLLYGIGGSGKSQLLNIVTRLLPADVVSVVSPYAFTDKFRVTELSTSVLNICGELSENEMLPGDAFKQVVDGSLMQGQYKGKPIFNFNPKATHWYCGNYLPKTKDGSEGFNRRWVILQFNRIVPESEKIRDLGEIIVAEEREAITAWCIGAMAELNSASDYDLPMSHYDLVNQMTADNDSIFFYLTSEEGPRAYSEGEIQLQSLYEAYRTFCYGTIGARPVGLRKFYAKLSELALIFGFSVGNSKVVGLTMDKEKGVIVSKVRR